MRSATMDNMTKKGLQGSDFNPRTPCGVRPSRQYSHALQSFISIHALHAECDLDRTPRDATAVISIHALHAECDTNSIKQGLLCVLFQSTHSMRSATQSMERDTSPATISIHALHAECDQLVVILITLSLISIHALHAECDFDNSLR